MSGGYLTYANSSIRQVRRLFQAYVISNLVSWHMSACAYADTVYQENIKMKLMNHTDGQNF